MTVINADCIEHMNTMPPDSVDSIVTDPPYHLTSIVKRFGKEGSAPAQFGTDGAYARASRGFMGKEWDGGDIAFRTEVWEAALRVAKPGAYLLAFGGTRTFHRMAVAIEDAGWEIRDTVMWVYGSGFPKSHNVSKGIDKAAGAEREVVGTKMHARKGVAIAEERTAIGAGAFGEARVGDITAPATEAAQQWDGWGTALKPAWEPIIMARKALDGTVAENVQKWGVGAINIDRCRIKTDDKLTHGGALRSMSGDTRTGKSLGMFQEGTPSTYQQNDQGRWPANLMHDGSEEVVELFPDTGKSAGGRIGKKAMGNVTNVPAGQYEAGDPGYGDSGSAARFFYCAKANKTDRNEGCEDLDEKVNTHSTYGIHSDAGLEWNGRHPENRSRTVKNNHPTVKPTALMRYLCKMVTPPAGIVLDPFCGSGSTGKGAILEGFQFIGVEKDPEYSEIASLRIRACVAQSAIDSPPNPNELDKDSNQLSMFK